VAAAAPPVSGQTLTLPLLEPMDEALRVHVRVAGGTCALRAVIVDGGAALQLHGIPPCAASAHLLLLLEVQRESLDHLTTLCISPPTALLLSPCAPMVAELQRKAEARAAAGRSMQPELLGLGCALQRGCSLRARIHASVACLRLHWAASLCEVLGGRDGAAAVVDDPGQIDTLALATYLRSVQLKVSLGSRFGRVDGGASAVLADTCRRALVASGWERLLCEPGWAGVARGSAATHASLLLRRSAAELEESGGVSALAALASEDAAEAAARLPDGWREAAALPFIRASNALLQLEATRAEGMEEAAVAVALARLQGMPAEQPVAERKAGNGLRRRASDSLNSVMDLALWLPVALRFFPWSA